MKTIRFIRDWWQTRSAPAIRSRARKVSPKQLETLESRVLLYAASGNAWPNKDLITISFMPDGTNLGGATSNLQSTFNSKFGSATAWQNQVLKAAQYWAQQTNINFAVVSDNGAAAGSGSYQQGDPNFGDIRIGGFNFGNSNLAQAYLPPPVNNYSIAGDIQINTGVTFNVGTQYDLFTVMVHEFGHALGLNHATSTSACMYATYNGVDSALNSDDISGIKSIYSAGAVRTIDSYDKTKSNSSTSAASLLTLNSTTKSLAVSGLDLTTSSDVDFFKIVVPTGATTTLKATVVSTGLSLLSPKVEIVVGSTTKATGAAGATEYGSAETATYTNATDLAAGKTVYIKVSSANSLAAFKTGKYALILNMGTEADPVYAKPNTAKTNGSPLSSGGGVAIKLGSETLLNSASTTIQQTSDRAVAVSAVGESVVTWASQNQDGSGWGIYARRFDANGVPQGDEFPVNTTTVGDQVDPSVAMDAAGNFLVTWTSANQDGNGYGVFARRFSVLGIPLGDEFRVNSTTANDQSAPSVAMDDLGNAVITWTSNGQDGSGLAIYARCYNTLGVSLGDEFRVNSTTSGDQSDSAVVVHRTTGEFVVTWTSAGQDGSGAGIYGRRYSGLLGLLILSQGGEFRVNATTTNDQIDSAIAMRSNGDFIVTWTSAGQDGSGTGIYAQRYHSSGVAQGTEIRVNTSTVGDQFDSSLAIDGGGEFYVTWTNAGISGAGQQVFGQQLEKNGNKKEAEFVVNTTTADDQSRSSVTIDSLGRVIVVWSGNGSGDGTGVFSQRYRTDLHPFSAEEHDHDDEHDHGDEHDEAVEASAVRNIESNRNADVGRRLEPVPFSAVPKSWREWLDARRESHIADERENQGSLTRHSYTRPYRSEARDSEFTSAIDGLFSSEAWLTGRHYRGVNVRA